MKLTMESTEKILQLDGVDVREWKGRTESGVEVLVYVHRVAVEHGRDASQFQRELQAMREPSSGGPVQPISLRHVL